MKFVVNTTNLSEHLTKISGTLVAKPTLPIIENFLFSIKSNKLTITATDLETTMSITMDVEASDDILLAIPSKMMLEILKNLPNQPITISINESLTIEIKSDYGKYKLNGTSGVDFPKSPEIDGDNSFNINSNILQNCISKTLFATSNDDMRQNLTGVFVQLEKKNIVFAATDANRLVRISRSDVKPGIENSFILPKKALNLLKNSLLSDENVVTVNFNKKNAAFNFGNIQLICRFIDEKYPDYSAVIPLENPYTLTINTDLLLHSVKRTAIFSNKSTHQIRLKISQNELLVFAEDFDLSNEADEKIGCDFVGDELEIGFNSKLLAELLDNLDATELKMELSSPNRAGIIKPLENEKNEDLLMLIMPMMINNPNN